MAEKLEIVTIRIPGDFKRELEAMAEEEDRTLSNLIRRLLVQQLSKGKKSKGGG